MKNNKNKSKFQKTCGEYRMGIRPIYIPWQPKVV